MKNYRHFLNGFGAVLLLSQGINAETFVLKSGKKIEGKILKQTDTEIVISVQVTANIKDEVTILKSELDKIMAGGSEEAAWSAIAVIDLGQDSVNTWDYAHLIKMCEYFLVTFPESTFLPLAKEKLGKLKDEQRRVDWGEVKIDGEWMSNERSIAEKMQIAGRRHLTQMRRFVANGQLVEAMNVFELMEKQFASTADYPNAVNVAKSVLPALKPRAEQAQAELKRQAATNAARIKSAQRSEKKAIEDEVLRHKKAVQAAVAAAEKTGMKWLPLQPATEQSLQTLLSRISAESRRLASLPIDKMIESTGVVETAERFLQAGDLVRAEEANKKAIALWPKSEAATRLTKTIAATKAKAAADEAARKNGEKASPGPVK